MLFVFLFLQLVYTEIDLMLHAIRFLFYANDHSRSRFKKRFYDTHHHEYNKQFDFYSFNYSLICNCDRCVISKIWLIMMKDVVMILTYQNGVGYKTQNDYFAQNFSK